MGPSDLLSQLYTRLPIRELPLQPADSLPDRPLRRLRRHLTTRSTCRPSSSQHPALRRLVRNPPPPGHAASPPSIPSSTAASWAAPPPPPGGRRRGPPASPSASAVVPEDLHFALEALHNLTTQCPDWAKRLDELSGQIDQRQVDLALFAEELSPCNTSLRNRGSTESLKPTDDGEAHPGAPASTSADEQLAVTRQRDGKRTSGLTNATTHTSQSRPEGTTSPTPSAVERQTPQVRAAAMAKARAALRRSHIDRKRGAVQSLASGDAPAVASKYRSKCLVIVYYDSYVQSFFEEVVKFVSASRSLMRKAKMAAKVAQIKRMAELEMPDDDSSDASDEGRGTPSFVPPQLSPSATQTEGGTAASAQNADSADGTPGVKLASSSTDGGPAPPAAHPKPPSPHANGADGSHPNPRVPAPFRPSLAAWSYSPHGAHGGAKQPPGILDELDKSLELVQSLCEQAAHQFLRDGDCSDEMVKIQERLTQTKSSADAELARLLETDADGSMQKLLAEGAPTRNRTYHPQMRRDRTGARASPAPNTSPHDGRQTDGMPRGQSYGHAMGIALSAGPTLEVDESMGGVEADSEKPPPQFEFRSTRTMGPRVASGL